MDAILLAAGNSARFGANKLLYEINGKKMYRYTLEHLYHQKQIGNLERVIVVSQYEEIFADIREHFPGVEMVCNLQPEKGISGSLKLGLEALKNELSATMKNKGGVALQNKPLASQACLFAVADQPCLTEKSLEKLIRMWKERGEGIVVAVSGERTGNPVIFGEKYYGELLEISGDVGGKSIVRRHPDDVRLCEIPEGELRDLDTVQEVTDTFSQNGQII